MARKSKICVGQCYDLDGCIIEVIGGPWKDSFKQNYWLTENVFNKEVTYHLEMILLKSRRAFDNWEGS